MNDTQAKGDASTPDLHIGVLNALADFIVGLGIAMSLVPRHREALGGYWTVLTLGRRKFQAEVRGKPIPVGEEAELYAFLAAQAQALRACVELAQKKKVPFAALARMRNEVADLVMSFGVALKASITERERRIWRRQLAWTTSAAVLLRELLAQWLPVWVAMPLLLVTFVVVFYLARDGADVS